MASNFKDYLSIKSDTYANYRPFREISFPDIEMSDYWNFNQLYGYITTWSAFNAFEKTGGQAEINQFKDSLSTAWVAVERKQKIIWPLSLRVGYVG